MAVIALSAWPLTRTAVAVTDVHPWAFVVLLVCYFEGGTAVAHSWPVWPVWPSGEAQDWDCGINTGLVTHTGQACGPGLTLTVSFNSAQGLFPQFCVFILQITQ